jgi:thioester reductase-like protein
MSKIQAYFADKTVLVTGATGFLGKAIVEKILRSLPDLRRLYLLIRPQQRGNRTIPALERFESEVLSSTVFNRLRRDRGAEFDDYVDQRVTVLPGDLTDDCFGLGEEDHRRLTAEVQVIINSAAVVVFDERLDLALELNTLGLRTVLPPPGSGHPYLDLLRQRDGPRLGGGGGAALALRRGRGGPAARGAV